MISGGPWAKIALFGAFTVLFAQAPISVELNTPVRATVGGWEPRVYQINLKSGQYLEAIVEEKGITLQVRLIDPAGKRLFETVYAEGTNGVYVIAQPGGLYRLEISALEPFDRPFGDCQVTVVRLENPTPEDRLRAEAFQAYLKAKETNTVEAYESAAGLFAVSLRKVCSTHSAERAVKRETQIVRPNSPSINCSWARGSPLATHLTRPFRIM
jgi:hypothetical protein